MKTIFKYQLTTVVGTGKGLCLSQPKYPKDDDDDDDDGDTPTFLKQNLISFQIQNRYSSHSLPSLRNCFGS
ncbi:hypothetical protein RIF29_20081 [Crotalaria pallida]|uniref:Uncharacterized protein n=1 Tax=Crotalaria pallida TaxID=3830 RepID=A0AAN9F0H0_CROPI